MPVTGAVKVYPQERQFTIRPSTELEETTCFHIVSDVVNQLCNIMVSGLDIEGVQVTAFSEKPAAFSYDLKQLLMAKKNTGHPPDILSKHARAVIFEGT